MNGPFQPQSVLHGTILIAEDEPSVRTFLHAALKTFGYRTLDSSSSAEALQIANEYPDAIHLLLTDLTMPGMNGVDLADHVLAIRPGIRVIYASGYSEREAFPVGNLPDYAVYLQKPFSIKSLAQAVRELLDRSVETRSASSVG